MISAGMLTEYIQHKIGGYLSIGDARSTESRLCVNIPKQL
jgi:hypothetical protein